MKRVLLVLLAVMFMLALTACKTQDNTDETQDDADMNTSDVTPIPDDTDDIATTPDDTDDAQPVNGYDVGNIMNDFSVPTIDDGTFTLSENLGKPVLINLFATWCPPCKAELPDIEELYGEYSEEVAFIIIDVGEDADTAADFAAENNYTMPFAYSLDGEPMPDYYVMGIPQTFVVDADGTIVAYFYGMATFEEFKSAIDEALGAN